MNNYKLPIKIEIALSRYVEHHMPTGGFLRAVLSNDLFRAFALADEGNRIELFNICNYIYNEIPGNCWGSPEKVNRWIEIGRPSGETNLEQLRDAKANDKLDYKKDNPPTIDPEDHLLFPY
jgi:hypothetical protein